MKHRHCHGYALRNVVDGNGHHNRQCHSYILKSRRKCGKALREIVHADCQRQQQPSAPHPFSVLMLKHLKRMRLVQVLFFRNKEIDKRNQRHAGKERRQRYQLSSFGLVRHRESRNTFGQQVDERHIHHHPTRQAKGKRQKTSVRGTCNHRHQATDSSRQTSHRSERQSHQNRFAEQFHNS